MTFEQLAYDYLYEVELELTFNENELVNAEGDH